MSKVYIFLADGFETIEGLTVVDVLRRAGIEITTVSINSTRTVTTAHKISLTADLTFEEADFSDAGMYVLPGGMPGTLNLQAHEGLSKLLEEATAKQIKLAAICAAPSILGQKGLLQGKKATCYPSFEEKLIGANVQDTTVVVDGDIITGRGMGAAIDFSLAIVKELTDEKTAQEVGEGIEYLQYFPQRF